MKLKKRLRGWLRFPFVRPGHVIQGRRYYGQFDPPLDAVLHGQYFADDRRDGVFVECGAFDGQTESTCKFFEETLGWRGVNLEPSPPIFRRLLRNRPRSLNVQAALSDRDGEATFTGIVHPDFGEFCTNGSLRHGEDHMGQMRKAGWQTREYAVRTTTWRRLVVDAGLTHVDLLVLDVEGAELQVLAGMAGCPVLPCVICVEHGHLGVPRMREAVEPLGYRYDGSRDVNSFFIRTAA